MRKLSFQEKTLQNLRNEKKRITRNALRGAARPWTLEECCAVFSSCDSHVTKLETFNKNIGSIFPLLLDLVANGQSIAAIERQMMLTPRMLWQWLEVREELADEVRRARGLRARRWDKGDGLEAP